MTNPYRAMCAELLAWAEHTSSHYYKQPDVLDRARALLAQPVAEGLTDEEIEEWADACSEAPLEEMDPEVHGWRRCFTAKEFSETIRAALDRWGRPTPQPVAVSERLLGDELCWWFEPDEDDGYGGMWTLLRIRGGTTRYTHWLPSSALPTPEATND